MPIDLKRRKAVMARSIKLGHCVCNPRKPCPCDLFKSDNICSCAGERPPAKTGPVALTRHVRKAGCASKIGQADLLKILGNLPPVTDPRVLVGSAAGDDAGVYRLDDERCLVQTVDVFTPCVDDPHLFGRIAAANSLSDCYAMGAQPLTALSIICYPIDELDGAAMEEMMRGGMETLEEAGCALLGGHSVNDEEVKCGFAITGLIETGKAVERNCARVGDALVLTKPLGTGMISFAAQMGLASPECLAEVGESMASLNKEAAELMQRHGANACTDITGFGLAGHLVEMARGSGVSVELDMSALPIFAPVIDCLANDIISGAVERNQEYAMAWVRVEDDSHEENLPILYDPQTSGGLLISLPESAARELVQDLLDQGHEAASIVGRIVENQTWHEHPAHVKPEEDSSNQPQSVLRVIDSSLTHFIGKREGGIIMENKGKYSPEEANSEGAALVEEEACCASPPSAGAPASEPCCASPPGADESAARVPAAFAGPEKFMAFIQEANKPGLIDERAKKLMAIALSVAQHCEPCLKIHLRGALKMGLSKAEIDEAAWLGIAFAGAPSMMLYNSALKELGM